MVIVIALAALGTASKKISDNVTKHDNLAGAPPAAQYRVGDTANTGGIQVTVYSFRNPHPPILEFDSPQAGSHYVVVNLQITNPSGNQLTFSSLLGFHLLDGNNSQYNETLMPGLSPSAPDGEFAAGQSIRGNVAFEVPDGTTGLKLRVQGKITAAGAVFALS